MWICSYDVLRNTLLSFWLRFEVWYRQYNVANCHRQGTKKSIGAGGVDQVVQVWILLIWADGNSGKVAVNFLSSKVIQFCSGGRQQAKLAKFFPNIFIFPYRLLNFFVHIALHQLASHGFTKAQELIYCRIMSSPQYFLCVRSLLLIRRSISEIIQSGFFLFGCDGFCRC